MKKLFILLMACLSLAVQGHAQAPEVLPQVFSPNAAELGKYGKVPVSYFNGLPNISIPLTELKAKDYTLPIYLTYHAGGNKPDQHPGWVGLGWTLHAGGCINRIINGKKDETTRYETGFTYDENPGYLYHATEFQTENWDKQTSSGNLLTHGYDYAPDEFQINIEGLNASFYFAGNGEIRIASRSDADFIVTYKMNDGANSIGTNNDRILDYRLESQDIRVFDTFFEFTIITKDGTEYVFGGTEDAIEYSIVPATHDEAYYGYAVDWDLRATANTWMLTKIKRSNGEVISLKYKHRNDYNHGIPVVMVDSHRVLYAEMNGQPYQSINTFQNDGNISFYYLLQSYLESIDCKYSSDGIVFKTGKSTQLSYDYDADTINKKFGHVNLFEKLNPRDYYEQLDRITKNNGESISFYYTNNAETRLKLDSLSISAPGSNEQRYKMTYDSESLPRYNSRKTDVWGYYNYEDPYNPTLRNSTDVDTFVACISRQRAEMLKKSSTPQAVGLHLNMNLMIIAKLSINFHLLLSL